MEKHNELTEAFLEGYYWATSFSHLPQDVLSVMLYEASSLYGIDKAKAQVEQDFTKLHSLQSRVRKKAEEMRAGTRTTK